MVSRIDGSVPVEERGKIIDDFLKSGKSSILIASLGTCACGINLVGVSVVIFAEYEWSPACLLQAEDRAHRINSVNKILIYYPVIRKTIDECILQTALKKNECLGRVFEKYKWSFESMIEAKKKIKNAVL